MSEKLPYREAMARLGAAVNIVTTTGPQGPYGMVVSAACSVSDAPPTILVCVNRQATGNALFKQSDVLCLNVLGCDQSKHSGMFSDPSVPSERRFGNGEEWAALVTGAPVLKGALASFDCRIVARSEIGSHTVFFGEVQAIQLGAQRSGLIYFNRDYHALRKAGAL